MTIHWHLAFSLKKEQSSGVIVIPIRAAETSELLDLNSTVAHSNSRYSAEADECASGFISSFVQHDVEIPQDHSFVILHSFKKNSIAERRPFLLCITEKHMDHNPREAGLRK